MRRANAAVIGNRCLIVVVAALVVLAAAAPGAPQGGQAVRLQGRVQWIAGEKMMLIPDNGDRPVEVDLKKASLDDYRTLTEGDPVVVSGVVSDDGTKLIALSIQSLGR